MMHIDWPALLTHYGYLAILVGTFFEGESILVMGGYAAHQGYLGLPEVLGAAFVGSFLGDQLWFVLGRLYGQKFLSGRPAWAARVKRVDRLLERYQTVFILGFRFLYGLRTISPIVLGTGRVRATTFVLLNAVGAVMWTVSIGFLGYSFGELMTRYLVAAKQYENYLFAGVIAAGIVGGVILHHRAKRAAAAPGALPTASGVHPPDLPPSDLSPPNSPD